MKKNLFVLALGWIFVLNIFSLQENDTSIGFSLSGIYDFTGNTLHPANRFYIVPSAFIMTYNFWDSKTVGFFVNLTMEGFPPINPNPGDTHDYIGKTAEMIIGPGFRSILNDQWTFRYSVGFNFLAESISFQNVNAKDDSHYFSFADFGIGGNVGLKFDITDAFNIVFGTNIAATFFAWVSENTDSYSSKWLFNPMLGIKPYVGVGFNSYRERTGSGYFGKPPRKR